MVHLEAFCIQYKIPKKIVTFKICNPLGLVRPVTFFKLIMCLGVWLDCARRVALKNLTNNSDLTCGVYYCLQNIIISLNLFFISTDLLDIL